MSITDTSNIPNSLEVSETARVFTVPLIMRSASFLSTKLAE